MSVQSNMKDDGRQIDRKGTGIQQPADGTDIRPGIRPRIVDRLRSLPIGLLLIATFLLIVAAGSLFGGMYLLAQTGAVGWWAAATALAGGPVIIYMTVELVKLSRWTWTALIALTCLLALSSIVRIAVSPDLPIAPMTEILIEAIVAYYLTRPSIRNRFRSPA